MKEQAGYVLQNISSFTEMWTVSDTELRYLQQRYIPLWEWPCGCRHEEWVRAVTLSRRPVDRASHRRSVPVDSWHRWQNSHETCSTVLRQDHLLHSATTTTYSKTLVYCPQVSRSTKSATYIIKVNMSPYDRNKLITTILWLQENHQKRISLHVDFGPTGITNGDDSEWC